MLPIIIITLVLAVSAFTQPAPGPANLAQQELLPSPIRNEEVGNCQAPCTYDALTGEMHCTCP